MRAALSTLALTAAFLSSCGPPPPAAEVSRDPPTPAEQDGPAKQAGPAKQDERPSVPLEDPREKKIAECNRLIEVIHKGMLSLKPPTATDESGAGAFKSMADTLDKVVADAAKVELTIPELQKYSRDRKSTRLNSSHL